MAKRNIKKIFIGLALIILAAVSVLTAFYFLEVKPELASREKIKSVKPKAHKTKVQKKVLEIKQEQQRSKENQISLESLVKEAETVYGKEEAARKEGSLWVDRKASKFIVTLGAVHGLHSGDQITVFEGDKYIGHAIVDTSFDVISYVHPGENLKDNLKNDYYRAVIE